MLNSLDSSNAAAFGMLQCTTWHRPPTGYLKVNVDATFFRESLQTGTCMVLQDDAGNFVLGRTILLSGVVDVDIGESMGFLEALSWVKNLNLVIVVVDEDAKLVVDPIRSSNSRVSIFGEYIQHCKDFLASYPSFSVNFVKMGVNSVAHEFARASRLFKSPHYWVDPPSFVVGFPDLSCYCSS
ncbi:hypothetical protein ACS0TY_011763 [Phlomoides rotata]